MADSENQQPVDTTQQVTSLTPTTRPKKNPKRVAAGKATAEKTRQAREQQKKALDEAELLIAKHKIQKKDEPPVAAPSTEPVAAPEAATVVTPSESTRNVLTTTQWLSVISIVVSLWGIYNKREEIKALFAKKPPQASTPVDGAPQPVAPKKKGGGVSATWIIELFICLDNNGAKG